MKKPGEFLKKKKLYKKRQISRDKAKFIRYNKPEYVTLPDQWGMLCRCKIDTNLNSSVNPIGWIGFHKGQLRFINGFNEKDGKIHAWNKVVTWTHFYKVAVAIVTEFWTR